MRFEHTLRLAVPRERAWALLMDVPAVALCVPGADGVTAAGDDRYRGAVRVSLGPVRLRLEGDVTVTARDEAAGEAAMRVEAADRAVGGSVRADLRMSLRDADGGSELRLVTEATLLGRIGDLGQPIVKRKADQIVAEFARCLERALAAGETR